MYFHVVFLGTSLTFTIIYIWSRKNQFTLMNFLGIVNFHAPLMPFVLTLVSCMLNGEVPLSDILGILAGHVAIVFEELFPHFFETEVLTVPH
jgi:Derlin-2/3